MGLFAPLAARQQVEAEKQQLAEVRARLDHYKALLRAILDWAEGANAKLEGGDVEE
jgi:hypothetical protein